MPFMSERLLACWEEDISVIHTPVDDLESFLWIVVWAVHAILEGRGLLDRDSMAFWNNFQCYSNTVDRASTCRGILLNNWISGRRGGSEAWMRWRPLITKLWNLHTDAETLLEELGQLQPSSSAALGLSRRLFSQYIHVLLDAEEDNTSYSWGTTT